VVGCCCCCSSWSNFCLYLLLNCVTNWLSNWPKGLSANLQVRVRPNIHSFIRNARTYFNKELIKLKMVFSSSAAVADLQTTWHAAFNLSKLGHWHTCKSQNKQRRSKIPSTR
jgi:hypothetical protein